VITKEFRQIEKHSCHSRLAREIVLGSSKCSKSKGGGANSARFALKELRLILATLMRRYELSLVPGQSHELRVHTVPWFKQGFYKVGVKMRT
jgi:hypothetical protein